MKKIRINDLLFYLAYIFLMFIDFSGQNIFIQEIKKVLLIAIIFFLFFNIYNSLKCNPKKNVAIIITMVIITFIIYVFSNIKEPFFMLLFIIAFKNLHFDNFIKNDFYIRICMLLFVATMCFFGFLPNEISITASGHYRYSIGFGSPNSLGLNCFMLILELLYLNKGKYNKVSFIFFILILLYVEYFVCYSRTAVLASIFSFILFYIYKNKIKKEEPNTKFSIRIISVSYIVLTLLSLMSIWLYDNNVSYINTINKLLSGRISYASYNFEYYDISFFGTEQIEKDYSIDWRLKTGVDNMYIFNLIFYGIIGTVYFSFLFYKTAKTNFFKNNIRIYLVFLLILFYGLSERYMVRITFNPFFLCSSYALFKQIDNEVKNNE